MEVYTNAAISTMSNVTDATWQQEMIAAVTGQLTVPQEKPSHCEDEAAEETT